MNPTYYNLSADPFRLSPDPRFCFPHRTYRKAMTYMRHALLRAEGFIIITGAPGIGKTALINDLFRDLGPARIRVARLVSTQLLAEDLLRLVAYQLNLAPAGMDKASLLNRVENFLRQQHREGRRTLLVVDEAQDVPGEVLRELRLLTSIQVDGQQLLQIFLVGQEDLRHVVSDPALVQLHQRVIAAVHLEPLDGTETREYIKNRLRRVGWQGDPLISNQAYAMIHRFSRGIPRQINQICSRLLLHGSLEKRNRLGLEDIKTVIEELHGEMLLPSGMREIADSMVWPAHFQQETYDKRPLARPVAVAAVTEVNSTAADPSATREPSGTIKPLDITAAAGNSSIAGIAACSQPEIGTAANDSYITADSRQDNTPDRPVRVAAYTPAVCQERRRRPLRLLSLVILLAGLLLFALDTDTSHHLQDRLATLTRSDTPAPKALQPAITPEPPADTDTESRHAPPAAANITPDVHTPVTSDSTATNDEAAFRADETAQRAAGDKPTADFSQHMTMETQPAVTPWPLSAIEEELLASGLPVVRTDNDNLRINLNGDAAFEFDSIQISDSAGSTLASLANVLATRDNVQIDVIGHTDSSGEPDYNVYLSQLRAQAVVDYLVEKDLPVERAQSEGRDDHDTRFEESTRNQPESRRRIEIYIRPPGEE